MYELPWKFFSLGIGMGQTATLSHRPLPAALLAFVLASASCIWVQWERLTGWIDRGRVAVAGWWLYAKEYDPRVPADW